jgi:hypothetical protein
MKSTVNYLLIAGVFVVSLGLAYIVRNNQIAQTLVTAPAGLALIAALFQIFRDQLGHDRAVALTELQNRFALGATSHMANVAFDRLVAFSEEYIAEVHATLASLFRNGPTDEALGHGAQLYRIRQKHALWLTLSIEKDLDVFESSLRKIGADAHWVEIMRDDPNRPKVVARLYKSFANLLGREIMGAENWEGDQLDESKAISMVVRRLRITLGIEELTQMRTALIHKAVAL